MSRYEDKWLDICSLLVELQSDGQVVVIPASNDTKAKRLSFMITGAFSGLSSAMLVSVLELADRFEFSSDKNKVIATVFVDLSATS